MALGHYCLEYRLPTWNVRVCPLYVQSPDSFPLFSEEPSIITPNPKPTPTSPYSLLRMQFPTSVAGGAGAMDGGLIPDLHNHLQRGKEGYTRVYRG